MMRLSLSLLSGLLTWAVWFALAYGLHGAQCAGSIPLSRSAGQVVQIGFWLATLAVIALLARSTFAGVAKEMPHPLRRTALYLQLTGFAATAFVGLPLLVLQPC